MARARIFIVLSTILIGTALPATAEESGTILAAGNTSVGAAIADFESTLKQARIDHDYGPLARIAVQLAATQSSAGDFDAAERILTRAVQSIDQSPDQPPGDLADVLIHLGDMRLGNSDYPAAAAHYQRAIAVSERSFGPQHISVATALDRRAQLHTTLSEFAKAETAFARAARIRERTLGLDHPDTALGHDNLARLNIARNNFPAATAEYRQALAIRRAAWGDAHEQVAANLDDLTELAFTNDDFESAISYAEDALAIRIELHGINAPEALRTRQDLAALRDAVDQQNQPAQPTIGAAGPEASEPPLPDPSTEAASEVAKTPEPEIAEPAEARPAPRQAVEIAALLAETTEVAAAPAPEQIAATDPDIATQTAPAPPYVVQLGSFRSEDSANSEWQRLQRTFDDDFGNRQLNIVRADLGDRGIFYRVRTGPFASSEQAAATCDNMARHDQPCLVIAP